MNVLDEYLAFVGSQPNVKWTADRAIEAMENLGKLDRMGFFTTAEADRLARSVRALYRKEVGLPRMDGDPVV